MDKPDIVRRLREVGVIVEEPVVLRSGQESKYYCDIKKSYGYPDILSALADEVVKLVPKEATCIAASGYGGLPLASVVATKAGLNFTAVRDDMKNHGRGGYIEGYIPDKKDVVVIVDDVVTSGSSVRETEKKLKDTGARLASAIMVVKRDEPDITLPYSWIFNINEIIDNEA